MAKILIVGAGRIGIAFAKIVRHMSSDDVVLLDSREDAIAAARQELVATSSAGAISFHVSAPTTTRDILLAEGPDAVVSCVPFYACVDVAKIAVEISAHYIDFTEDVAVTEAITKLGVSDITMVPQTGLAPGLISYIGLDLVSRLDHPQSLKMRVGALPQVSFGPSFYSITWSPDGLINEYLQPTQRKKNHIIQTVPPLDDLETVCVNGITYEAFTTSGGVGNLDAYGTIPDVEYKTLRYPGHLDFIQKLLSRTSSLEEAVAEARATFSTTHDDVVVLIAVATDRHGKQLAVHHRFFPHEQLGLTALELTTAGTGVAVVELILRGELPTGILLPSQISLDLIKTTRAYSYVFSPR